MLGLEKATLRQILEVVKQTYCGTVGIEFMHIQDPEQKAWIQERIEGTARRSASPPRASARSSSKLTETEGFEQFLHVKYTGTKRFGLDGGESADPGAGADHQARRPSSASRRSSSACRTAAGSTCWPT